MQSQRNAAGAQQSGSPLHQHGRSIHDRARETGTAPRGTFTQEGATVAQIGIEQAGDRFIGQLRALGRKKSTLEDYESTLRVHLVPFFGERPLGAIDVSLVEEFIYATLESGKAPKSVRNYLGFLHSVLAYGMKRGWCDRNPAALVDKPRTETYADIRFLSLDELEAILGATPATPLGMTDRLVFLAAAMTGMRRGEVIAIRWQDIDWAQRQIRVRRSFTRGQFSTPKSRRSNRAVPLATRLADELRTHYERTPYRSDDNLVFAHPEIGSVLDPSKLRKRFLGCVRRAGVRPVRFHDLRHTFGTQMAAAGAPMRAIQAWLGHADLRTTLIYADYALDPNRGALYAEQAFGTPSRPAPIREAGASCASSGLRAPPAQ